MFAGPSTIQTSPNMNSTAYPERSMYSAYPSSGASHAGFEIASSQTRNPAFSSPPMGFPQGYQPPQSHATFFQGDLGDVYGSQHPPKRQRQDDVGFYEEHSPEEKEGGAGKTDPANKRP
jgi:hypothetical protein